MLELVNRARANPAAEAARQGVGLNDGLPPGTISPEPKAPYAFHPKLIDAAWAHTRWMLDDGNFSHTGVGGSDPGTRMKNAGYTFTGASGWGENISWGGTTGTPDLVSQTIARHDGLFKSPGHRGNICNSTYRDIGIGLLADRFQGSNAVMATQKFAYSGSYPAPLVLGVVFEDRDGDKFYDPGEGVAGVTVTPADGSWEAVTSTSGGYAVPYTGASGNLPVTFSGGPLARPVEKSVPRTGGHVKLDLTSMVTPVVGIVPSSMVYTPAAGFRFQVSGTPGTPFRLHYSRDLRRWVDTGSRVLENPAMTLTHRPAPDPGAGFYKVTW